MLEWIGAALGLLLTLAMVGHLVIEAFRETKGPPRLSVTHGAAELGEGGYTVPVTVHNKSDATAEGVEIRGALETAGQVEERRAAFNYVPGQGEAKGGLVFQSDPAKGRLRVTAEGYSEP